MYSQSLPSLPQKSAVCLGELCPKCPMGPTPDNMYVIVYISIYIEIDIKLYTYKHAHTLQHFGKALPLFWGHLDKNPESHSVITTVINIDLFRGPTVIPTLTVPTLLSRLPISKRLDSSAPGGRTGCPAPCPGLQK